MTHLKITQEYLKKLKNLKKLFHLSMDDTIYLAINYAYEYSNRLNTPISSFNLEEESNYKSMSLYLSNDFQSQLDDLDADYEDILYTGIDLLFDQNMIYPKKNYKGLIKLGMIMFFANFLIFSLLSLIATIN